MFHIFFVCLQGGNFSTISATPSRFSGFTTLHCEPKTGHGAGSPMRKLQDPQKVKILIENHVEGWFSTITLQCVGERWTIFYK